MSETAWNTTRTEKEPSLFRDRARPHRQLADKKTSCCGFIHCYTVLQGFCRELPAVSEETNSQLVEPLDAGTRCLSAEYAQTWGCGALRNIITYHFLVDAFLFLQKYSPRFTVFFLQDCYRPFCLKRLKTVLLILTCRTSIDKCFFAFLRNPVCSTSWKAWSSSLRPPHIACYFMADLW